MLSKQHMHAYYMSVHVSPYAYVGEGLHVDRAYTNATYAAGAACMRAHPSEHNREDYSVSGLICCHLANTLLSCVSR